MSVEDATKVREGFPKPFPNIPNNVVEQLRLNGKVLVVNGAADGLGYSVAEGYAEAGGNVALGITRELLIILSFRSMSSN